MTRVEFLSELRRCLAQLPPEETDKRLAYYEELFADMQEDGLTEQEAAARLGDPAEVAQDLLTDLPLGTLVKTRVKSAGGLSALTIVLLVLGFPLWFPLLIAFAAVILSILITLWALVLSFGAVVLALGVTAAALLGGVFFGYLAASPLMLLGLALIAGGVCLLGALLLKPLCRGMAKLCTQLVKWVKSLFIKNFIKRRAEK